MRRRYLLIVLVAAASLASAAIALALPQQQGSVDLLTQYNGQWQGPSGGQTGASIAALGDVFGTSRGALAIGAPQAGPGGRQAAGSVYVVDGQPGDGSVDLTALSGRGYRIDGGSPGDQLGFSLASLKLANGDPALAIGAPYANPSGRSHGGEVYIVDLAKLHGDLDLSSQPLDPAVVSVISGPAACAEAGYALADAGPIGGDKADGLLVGSPGADPKGCPQTGSGAPQGGNTGAAFLVYGSGLPAGVDLASGGSAVSEFDGVASGDRTGAAVAPAGSPGSFMIGAPYASPAGRSGAGSVYLLHDAAPGQVSSLATPPAGSTVFEGAAADDALGFSLSNTTGFAAGDPAGRVELALGAPQASPSQRTHAGSVFLVPADGQPATVDLSTLGSSGGPAGGRIDGADPGDEAGYAVAGVGDLNGDGTPDLAIGAPFMNSQTGQGRFDNGAAYVLYGGSGPLSIDLAAIHSRGYIATGARDSDEAGTAVAGSGDVNGDGRPDLLIGAPFAENTSGSTPTVGGAVYALFGFGTPALSYSMSDETTSVGDPMTPLTPNVRATGQPHFSVSPALPDGVVLNSNTGEISGTPSAPSPSTAYTVQMSDLAGVANATVTLEVTGGGGSNSGGAAGGSSSGPGGGTSTASGGSTSTPSGSGLFNGARAGCASHSAPATRSLGAAGSTRGLRVRGTAVANRCAHVARVQLAVARLVRGRCLPFLAGHRFGTARRCASVVWLGARGTTRWSFAVPGPLPAGSYVVRARAIDSTGTREPAPRSLTVRLR